MHGLYGPRDVVSMTDVSERLVAPMSQRLVVSPKLMLPTVSQ